MKNPFIILFLLIATCAGAQVVPQGFLRPHNTFTCGTSIVKVHVAGEVAPVSKTVTYGIVSTTLFGGTKCAITQNLGADRQATAVSDATEASAGWYWQFNRKQGYKHTGATPTTLLTPSWTTTSINESSDWVAANDPCTFELGTGWRIPTKTEWTTADGGWTTWTDPSGSGLILHAAGFLYNNNGSLSDRGSGGYYWSSTQDFNASGWFLFFAIVSSQMLSSSKEFGFSARCVRDY